MNKQFLMGTEELGDFMKEIDRIFFEENVALPVVEKWVAESREEIIELTDAMVFCSQPDLMDEATFRELNENFMSARGFR